MSSTSVTDPVCQTVSTKTTHARLLLFPQTIPQQFLKIIHLVIEQMHLPRQPLNLGLRPFAFRALARLPVAQGRPSYFKPFACAPRANTAIAIDANGFMTSLLHGA